MKTTDLGPVLHGDHSPIVEEGSNFNPRERVSIQPLLTDWAPGVVDIIPAEAAWSHAIKTLALTHRFSAPLIDHWEVVKRLSRDGGLIGVHFRNSDYQGDFDSTIANLSKELTASGIGSVYWATDDKDSIKAARERLPGINIIGLQQFGFHGRRNLHYGVAQADAEPQLVLALSDLFLLSTASRFLPSPGESSWKLLVPLLRSDLNATYNFFGVGDSTFVEAAGADPGSADP